MFNLGAPSDKARDLDYLLEDEEEHKSNTGLIFLTILALGMVVGLGWLRWRNGGFAYLSSLTTKSQSKPTTPADSSVQTPASPEQANPVSDSAAQPSTAATDAGSQPSIAPVSPPATDTTTPPVSSAASPASSAAGSAPSPDPNAPAASAAPDTHDSTNGNSPDKTPAPAAEAAAPPPAPTKPKPVAKPAPKPASKPTDPVVIGEHYLYGSQGFPQNCERGLRYVKPAADHSNPKAMITMGALYATGHCLSRDLPTAYRFFALALRGDPENAALRQNTERVWKQMTAEERKQAIRMTQ
jgi:TPR repeat protein